MIMALGQTNVQQPQYEDCQPSFGWIQDSESHNFIVMLPGFRKEQLKVEINSSRILRVSGERKTSENKFLRFKKENGIPNDANTNGIRARFESGVLCIRLPKTNTYNRDDQDFEPFFEWTEDRGSVTLTIMLPGFRKDELKVQVTSTPILRIKGEREATQNVLLRFSKEFPIPSYCDTDNVTARFESGKLHVKFPKIETPLPPPPPPPPPPTTNNDKPQEQEQTKNEEQKVAAPVPQQEASSQEGNNNNNNNNSDQQKEKEEAAIVDEKDQEKKSKEAMQNNVEKEKGKEAVTGEVVGDVDKKVSIDKAAKERKAARRAKRLEAKMLGFKQSVDDNWPKVWW